MSNQVSAARLEANRRNAQRATGPRTPEGKARASRNAITHGLLSKPGPLAPIPPAATGPVTHDDHASLIAAFTADFRPANTLETSLVADLASLRHRLNHLTAIESGLFEKSLHSAIDCHPEYASPGQETIADCLAAPSHMHIADAYQFTSHSINLLSFYETRLKRDFHRTLAELRRTQDLRLAAQPKTEADEQDPFIAGPTLSDGLQAAESVTVIDAKHEIEAPPVAEAAELKAIPKKEQTNPTPPQPTEITSTCESSLPSPGEAVNIGQSPIARAIHADQIDNGRGAEESRHSDRRENTVNAG